VFSPDKTIPFAARFPPDGARIRFSLQTQALNSSLWEVGVDGNDLHQLLGGWHSVPNECCGRWTADGRYYVFESGTSRENNIFALAETTSIFRKISHRPIQLTTGPILYSTVVPDINGRRLFVQGAQRRGELVRYDAKIQQFVPFLEGISATDVAFSRDGQWVTYVSIPDLTLWRSRVDGTERLQLTYPPGAASLPCWSPDGTRIAFHFGEFGKPWKIFLVSPQGGLADELLSENANEIDATWSADGKQLAFGCIAFGNTENIDIQVVNVKTRQFSALPGSKVPGCPGRRGF
jgi:Tol biopolymer transport system component